MSQAAEGGLPGENLGISRHTPAAGAPPSGTIDPSELSRFVRELGASLGLTRLGVTPATRMPQAAARWSGWWAEGLGAGLDYLAPTRGDRADPTALLPDAKSVIVAALAHGPFRPDGPSDPGPAAGSVAAYARGEDYHLVLRDKLRALANGLATRLGRELTARICVDSAPLLERELAAAAGVGFIGKNTMLIAPGLGSGLMLGELILTLEIAPDAPIVAGCGSCRACLDVCPTSAFVAPHRLDARRCVSYLTIEHQGSIPVELRAGIGSNVFGCDLCQDVCPYNASLRQHPTAPELEGRVPGRLPLVELLELGNARYRKLVKRTALRRTTRDVLARNAAIALGNSGTAEGVDSLAAALASHSSAVVRAHAAWALGRLGNGSARAALEQAANSDAAAEVREEARAALATLDGSGSTAYR